MQRFSLELVSCAIQQSEESGQDCCLNDQTGRNLAGLRKTRKLRPAAPVDSHAS